MAKTEKDDFQILLEDIVQDNKDALQAAEEMRDHYRAVLKQQPLELPEYARLISIATEAGAYEYAIPICKEAVKNFPNQGTLYLFYSICLYQLDRFEESKTILEEGFAKDPKFAKEYQAGEPAAKPPRFLQ